VMTTIIGSMLGFYFGAKSSENATRLVNEAHNAMLQSTIENNERNMRLIRVLHQVPGQVEEV